MIDDFCPSEKTAALPLSPSISPSLALPRSLSLALHLSKVLSTVAFLAAPFRTLVMIHFLQFITSGSSVLLQQLWKTHLFNIVSDCRDTVDLVLWRLQQPDSCWTINVVLFRSLSEKLDQIVQHLTLFHKLCCICDPISWSGTCCRATSPRAV